MPNKFSALLCKLFAEYGSRLLLFPATACEGLKPMSVILTDEKNKQFSNVLP